jgi:hypothetical protein
LIELNPLGACTVKIATSRTTIMGPEARGTKAPQRISNPPTNLDNDCRSAEKKCEWHTHRVQDGNEVVRSTRELGVAVLKKSVGDHESKRQREKTGRRGSGAKAGRQSMEANVMCMASTRAGVCYRFSARQECNQARIRVSGFSVLKPARASA